jgi:hypothetical protein
MMQAGSIEVGGIHGSSRLDFTFFSSRHLILAGFDEEAIFFRPFPGGLLRRLRHPGMPLINI